MRRSSTNSKFRSKLHPSLFSPSFFQSYTTTALTSTLSLFGHAPPSLSASLNAQCGALLASPSLAQLSKHFMTQTPSGCCFVLVVPFVLRVRQHSPSCVAVSSSLRRLLRRCLYPIGISALTCIHDFCRHQILLVDRPHCGNRQRIFIHRLHRPPQVDDRPSLTATQDSLCVLRGEGA